MKYFTKNWYREMQVSGFLVYPDTKEDWNECIAYYKAEGIDYKNIFKQNLKLMRDDLIEFLPRSFYPYIQNESINSKYPCKELRLMMKQWQKDYNKRFENDLDTYNEHYQAIKDKLPNNVANLCDIGLHDSVVESFDISDDNTYSISLDCSNGFSEFTNMKVTFIGVESIEIDNELKGATWISEEIYITDDGFELNVLFDCPLTEFKIRAKDIKIV